eukprot:TRINITY_DN3454_c0_g1_i3.p3 TRINITY_DN3454_c0_g1~~TRINITY_DN3454_c0_g1_i3.p3  ORF type:complete len:152 (-),score=26.82 TRINITY_DN3454_c0_g1_i3:1128-1583(-)
MERLHAQIAAFPEVTERLTRDSLNQLAELDALCQAERRERLLREAEIEALKQQIEAEKHLQSDLRREIEKMRENSSRDAVTIADKEAARLDLVHALAARDQQIAVLQEVAAARASSRCAKLWRLSSSCSRQATNWAPRSRSDARQCSELSR